MASGSVRIFRRPGACVASVVDLRPRDWPGWRTVKTSRATSSEYTRMTKRRNRSRLESYISKWPELERDIIFKQILDASFLKTALDTEGGRSMLNDAIRIIADKTMELISLCTYYDDNLGKIRDAANEVRISYELLKRWATVLTTDEEHRKRAN